MKSEKLLFAFGNISDDILDEAATVFSAQSEKHQLQHHIKRPLSKAAIVIAVAIILMLSSFATAMAVDEDFREAVFTFLRISTSDVVLPVEGEPKHSDIIENIYSTQIENTANVEYIRITGNFDYSDGLIYVYDETRDSFTYYKVIDGKLTKLKTNDISFAYTWHSEIYNIAFNWCEDNGKIYSFASGKESATDAAWNVSPVNDSTDLALLTLSYGRLSDYSQCNLLLDLRTQEVTNIFNGCGVSELSVMDTEFSPDMSKALLTCDNGDSVYYCDIAAKALQDVSKIAGMKVTSAWFLDNNTLCCIRADENERYACRTVNISTGEYTDLFSDMSLLGQASENGIMFMGCRYGLYIDMDRNTYVFDFKTGNQNIVEGFTYPQGSEFVSINSTGTKMLYTQTDTDAKGLGVSEVGVLDLQKHTFTLLDRKGYEARYEASIGWFDENRIAIRANNDNYGYLYLYTIE